MKVFGQNSDMQVIAVLRGGREARVCLDENPGVKEYLCCLGSPKKSWSDAYRELVEQRARVQERPCRTRANYITILENVQVDASKFGASRVLRSNIRARQHHGHHPTQL
jgi:hypothetical protein